MTKRALGKNGPLVAPIGFGLMGISVAYGEQMSDDAAFALLDRAIELGATHWDPSDFYGGNEALLGRYFKARPSTREKVFLATKFGAIMGAEGLTIRGDYEYVIDACNASLKRLGVDYIDLYYAHRIDPKTPIEITMRALVQLKKEGKIRHIGLSEASPATLRRAHAIHPVAAHQLQYSAFELAIEHAETPLLAVGRELGIALVAYSPLNSGLLSGKIRSPEDLGPNELRRSLPRFQPENFHHNLEIVDAFGKVGEKYGATASQLALAWLLAQGNDIFPIPGTRRAENLEENVKAAQIELSAAEIEVLDRIVRAADVRGAGHNAAQKASTLGDTPPLVN